KLQRTAHGLGKIILVMALQPLASNTHKQLIGLQAMFHAEGFSRANDGSQARSRRGTSGRRMNLLLPRQGELRKVEVVPWLGCNLPLRSIAQTTIGHILALA